MIKSPPENLRTQLLTITLLFDLTASLNSVRPSIVSYAIGPLSAVLAAGLTGWFTYRLQSININKIVELEQQKQQNEKDNNDRYKKLNKIEECHLLVSKFNDLVFEIDNDTARDIVDDEIEMKLYNMDGVYRIQLLAELYLPHLNDEVQKLVDIMTEYIAKVAEYKSSDRRPGQLMELDEFYKFTNSYKTAVFKATNTLGLQVLQAAQMVWSEQSTKS